MDKLPNLYVYHSKPPAIDLERYCRLCSQPPDLYVYHGEIGFFKEDDIGKPPKNSYIQIINSKKHLNTNEPVPTEKIPVKFHIERNKIIIDEFWIILSGDQIVIEHGQDEEGNVYFIDVHIERRIIK